MPNINKKKVDKFIQETLKRIGPVPFFELPYLTNKGFFTKAQQAYIFDQYIIKIPQKDKWRYHKHFQFNNGYNRIPNLYQWKNFDQMCSRYRDYISNIPTTYKTRQKKYAMASPVAIEAGNFLKAIEYASDNKSYSDVDILNKIYRVNNGEGKIIITNFYRNKSGRLYTSLQNITRPVRKILFGGWHDYDMNSALPSIFYQLSEDKPQILLDYISNKDRFRKHFADLMDCDVSTAKKIINALFYGVKSHSAIIAWDLKNKESITYFVKTFGEKANVLTKDDIFLSLAGCLNKITKDISNSIRQKSSKVNGKWNIKNDNGDLLILGRWNYQKVASHFYFGIERQILKACGIDDENVILIHDGFIIDEDIELEMLEGKVKEDLGLDITFSKELL